MSVIWLITLWSLQFQPIYSTSVLVLLSVWMCEQTNSLMLFLCVNCSDLSFTGNYYCTAVVKRIIDSCVLLQVLMFELYHIVMFSASPVHNNKCWV